MKKITVLGSTGSIGVNTLDVVSRHPDKYTVKALTANTNVESLLVQCIKHKPEYAVMVDGDAAEKLEQALKNNAPDVTVLSGVDGLVKVAELDEVDYVMAAIVGAAGLLPTLAAAKKGKRVLLANKEALVMSGKLFMDTVEQNNAELLPIDSEHNAIFQCMPNDFGKDIEQQGVKKILLTASGGPFRTTAIEQLSMMTPEQACAHPNWVMGRKISVDSATMMNKGLEIIEACWLFHVQADFIQVVIHPQSVIHSMVQYNDGSVLAQLGNPDMRTPIAYGLAWPERIDAGVERLDLFDIAQLDFVEPDEKRFPCLRLAREAMQQGGTSSAILNAANEIAVNEFLNTRIRFTDIDRVIETVLENVTQHDASTLEIILDDDKLAREYAIHAVKDLAA
ncbi:MAG: 1-deoxy-D-xylulose-5-phosphate reductoisomerase [Proteobacteria bacterium]|nr:1-deoxy-D-xylulose-5-phosphate reductoisomerase [Pseudomonadota bacterium]NOG60819.1 1-deoxy-D-xylulose-5-phosphate reductoisomerase [Pseudomonadota bacterium]